VNPHHSPTACGKLDLTTLAVRRTRWPIWKGGRAVEGSGLENRQRFTPLVGSNPTPSATFHPEVLRVAPSCSLQAPTLLRWWPSARRA
jgi:hypothetical protein